MAVILETSLGDLTIDLHTDDCPTACKNFLKLCKIKYYNNCIFYNVQKDFIAQTGDRTNTGKGGESIYGLMYGEQARFFEDEHRAHLRHDKVGCVSYATAGPNSNGSQFFITLRGDDLSHLDDKATLFGEVSEGFNILEDIGTAFCDEDGRPYKNIRIKHVIVIEDPFDDLPGMERLIPPQSPPPVKDGNDVVRLEDEDEVDQNAGRTAEEIEEAVRKKEAQSRAEVLEMIGDLPFAEVKPPENVLFVCKLNPVTEEEDLELIFSRFGKIVSCEIIRDWKTEDSLQYAFIEYEDKDSAEKAYFKMDNVLVDDRRIHVDFSQSVSRMVLDYRQNKEAFRKTGVRTVVGALKGKDSLQSRGLKMRGDAGKKSHRDDGKWSMVFDAAEAFGGEKKDVNRDRRRRSRSRERRRRSRSRSREGQRRRRSRSRSRERKRHHGDHRDRDRRHHR